MDTKLIFHFSENGAVEIHIEMTKEEYELAIKACPQVGLYQGLEHSGPRILHRLAFMNDFLQKK